MAYMPKFLTSFVGATAMAVTALVSPAQAWAPVKPVNFIIMAGAGGGADQIARFLQSEIAKEHLMPRPLVPVNKGGGSGAEALIAVNTTNDPNYTLLVTLNSFFTTPIRQPNLHIDVSTFTPIAMMGVDPFVLWVNKSAGITTFEDWVAYVKAHPGYVVGGTGQGQEDSIVFAYLASEFGLKFKYIPYKGGGTVAKELAGNQIMATVNNPSEAKGFYESGDVVPLIAFSDKRLDMLPNVRTMKEIGHDFSYYNQRAVVGAPRMSADAAAYYQEVFSKVYHSKAWQDYMTSQSLAPLWMNTAEQKAYWQTQIKNHEKLMKMLSN